MVVFYVSFIFCSGIKCFLFVGFQIAYRTAANRFPRRLAELFLVLSDNLTVATEADATSFQPLGRGQKHRHEDDQMSVE